MRPLFMANDCMRDFPNHDILEGSRFLGEATIPTKYQLVLVEGDTGAPDIVEAAEVGIQAQDIHGELYEVSESVVEMLRKRMGKARLVGLTVETAAGPEKARSFVGASYSIEAPLVVLEGSYRRHRAILEQSGIRLYRRFTRGTNTPQDQMLSQRGKKRWIESTEKTPAQIAQEMDPQVDADQFRAAMDKTVGYSVGWNEVERPALELIRLANRRMNRDHDGRVPAEDAMAEVVSRLQDAMGDPDGRMITMVLTNLTTPSGEEGHCAGRGKGFPGHGRQEVEQPPEQDEEPLPPTVPEA